MKKLVLERNRCDAEIDAILNDRKSETDPAWLVTLGIEDWEKEKRILDQEVLVEMERLKRLDERRAKALAEMLGCIGYIAKSFPTSIAGKIAAAGIVNVHLELEGKPALTAEQIIARYLDGKG